MKLPESFASPRLPELNWLVVFRQRTIRLLLGTTSVIATIAMVYIIRTYLFGPAIPSWKLWAYSVAFLSLLFLTLAPRISTSWRSLGFLVLLYGFSVFSFYSSWLVSSGRVFLIAMIVLSTILVGVRAGAAAAVLSLLTYFAFSAGYVLGWLDLPEVIMPNQVGPLVIEGFGFLMTVGMVSTALWLFREGIGIAHLATARAQKARVELSQHARDLDDTYHLLEERTRHLEMANQALENQMWQANGVGQLNDFLRQDQALSPFANSVVRFLCSYASAEIGGIFVLQEDNRLHQVGSFAEPIAYDNRGFGLGEGLVGQAALGKQTMMIQNIPAGHLVIRSGLGETSPTTVVLVPLRVNEQVNGVLELGFLEQPAPRQVQFLESVSESIAMAFNTVRTRQRVESLLAETIQQAEALRAQEEELRQANTELENRTRHRPKT